MLIKMYCLFWGFLAGAAILLFAANSLTMLNLVVLGLFAFGLTFMGMMGVLPAMVSHPAVPKPAKAQTLALQPPREVPVTGFHIFKSA